MPRASIVGMDRSSAETIAEGFEENGSEVRICVRNRSDHWGRKDVRDLVNYSVFVSDDGDDRIEIVSSAVDVGDIFQDESIRMRVFAEEQSVSGVVFFSESLGEVEEYASVTYWSDRGKKSLADLVWGCLDDIGIVTPDIIWNIIDSYESISDLQDETKTGFSDLERVTWEKAVLIAEAIPGNRYEGDSA